MDERDLVPAEPAPKHGLDQRRSARAELGGGRSDVGNLERDVVQAGPSPLEEPSDRRVRAQRGDELDTPSSDQEVGRLDAFVLDAPSQLDGGVEQTLVRRDRLLEIVDRERDVVNGVHLH
jgi:hypothetical protein